MYKMAVAIISFNTRDLLECCLRSVIACGAQEIVVVDNGSSDGTPEMVLQTFPEVRLLQNHGNPGYGAAANQAVAACGAPYVLVLNADTVLHPGAVDGLSTYLDRHPRAAIAGPRLVNPDGSLQPSCFPLPTPLYELLDVSNGSALLRFVPLLRSRYLRTWQHDRPRVVPWVLGAALAIRRSAFEEVGGFDESYFMYSEEIDLCYRLQEQGWQTHFTPAATIVHVGGASSSQYRAAMAVRALTSRLQFYHRHFSSRQILQLRLVMTAGMLAKMTRERFLLHVARAPSRRERLIEDLRIWRTVLSRAWGGPAREKGAVRLSGSTQETGAART